MAETVAITDYDFGDVEVERSVIEAAGFRLDALQCKSEDELVASAARAAAVVTQYATVGAKSIANLPRLRHIARYGVGTDIVDVDAAAAAGVLVTNVPADYCRDEVADHVLAMLLFFARGLRRYDEATHQGTWRWQAAAPLRRLRGSCLGIVGLGNIGRAIAERALGFGLDVRAHDPYVEAEAARRRHVRLTGLGELLGTSDYVAVQVPLTEETRGLFNARTIAQMKRGAVLVNTSRGPIVDSGALYEALARGHLAGAAVDDLPEEPAKRRTWTPDNPLFGLSSCIITPHVAYYSEESLRYARTFAAREVVRVLRGEPPHSPVNLDRLRPGGRRLPGGGS
ncbi:MAG: C-terminal binding protein [Streptosporangiaceae bacterium]